METMLSGTMRLCFIGAFVLVVVAVFERLVNLFGYTILRGVYSSGRLLDFAAVLLVFVITLLLRQIRDQRSGA